MSSSARVAIIDTSHVQELLASRRRHKSGTTGSRNETDTNGTALSGDLAGDSVRHARYTTPVSTADGRNVELGSRNGTAYGSGNLRRALDTETNVSSRVTDSDKCLEARALTGRRLFLDGHYLHHLQDEKEPAIVSVGFRYTTLGDAMKLDNVFVLQMLQELTSSWSLSLRK
jgi:hypothetical protein